ncbi:MAG: outer membrane protein assembly factor [Gemmatimonadota bacterium]|nr:outer membrane protein assembly factor [Gemmatimonadota bacterium]
MVALLVAVLFAQTSVTINVGSGAKKDSVAAARDDSMQLEREARRDSIRIRRIKSDSVDRARRLAKRVPLTPARLASAFRDPGARTLLTGARAARLEQDTALRGYDATSYERISVGMGFKRIGRDRLLMRHERAARVVWTRGSPVLVQLLGKRMVMPMLEGAGDAEIGAEGVAIPYFPGRESLWIGSGLAKADVSESEIIHPLASGAEAYYTYATGDSVSFQLPGGNRIQLRELVVRPREPKWNVALGSLWFDIASSRLVRAVFRLAEPMDIWAKADEEADDPDDKPPRWVKALSSPLTAKVNAVTVEYGLHEGRFWMPRLQSLEGEGQAGFVHAPVKLEQSFKYASVNGSLPAIPQIAAIDTAQDSTSRAYRRQKRRDACKDMTNSRSRTSTRFDGSLMVITQVPCDTTKLAHSPELPKSIYDEGEEVFGVSERDALIAQALTLGAQPGFIPQKPVFTYGLGLTRYNRIEGLSTGLAVRQSLGAGYTARALARIGTSDPTPTGELGLSRTDGRNTIGVGAYRRLASANDFADPFSFGSSLSALLFGRDEGFYYRTTGVELTGARDDSTSGTWRLFAEHHSDVSKQTDFSLAKSFGSKGFTENIRATRGNVLGLALEKHGSRGLDPHGLRTFGSVKVEGAAGDFDYARGMFDATVTHGLGPRLDGALTVGAGTSGGTMPVQRLWYLGGTQTVRGQRAGAAIGDAYWLTRAELGSSFVGARPVIFGDLGWAGTRDDWKNPGRPLSGVGAGVSFMDGLVRFDVARGIYPEKKIRTNLYVEARF